MNLGVDEVNAALKALWAEAAHWCTDISPTHAVAAMDLSRVGRRPGGFVPGPTQFSAADSALWFLVFGALDRVEAMALTSELSIRFLRPGVGDMLYARADLDRRGRTSVVGTVRVWTDDNIARPCATAQGTYMLPPA